MTEAALNSLDDARPPRSQWLDFWDQFRTHRGALFGMSFFLCRIACGFSRNLICGPWMRNISISVRAIRGRAWRIRSAPTSLAGDTLSRLMAGGQVSLAVGVTAMALSLLLGTLIGVMAGYFKRLDGLLMRLTDLFLALPLLPLLLVIIMLFRDTLRSCVRTGNRHFHPDGIRYRHNLLDADGAHRSWRCAGDQGA